MKEIKIQMKVIRCNDHIKMYKEIICIFQKYNIPIDETLPHLDIMKQTVEKLVKQKYGEETTYSIDEI